MTPLFNRMVPHFAIDARALAAFRIALAGLWILELFYRFPDAEAHYSDLGVLPRLNAAALFPDASWSTLWLWGGSATFAQGVFALSFALTLAFGFGWRTRWTGPLTWFLCIAIQSRNEMVLYGADHMLRVLFFFSCFLPIGQSRHSRPPSEQNAFTSPWTAAILLQVIYFYLFGALLKSGSEWTSEGTALYYALEYDQLTGALGKELLAFPSLLKALTFGVLTLEYLSPLLLLATRGRARLWAIALFAIFHLGIAATMRLALIPYVNLAALLLFLPPAGGSKQRTAVATSSRGMVPAVLLIIYVLVWNLATLGAPQSHSTWRWPGYLLRIDQDWGFFAPRPYKLDGWWQFPAETADGMVRDAWDGGPIPRVRPSNVFDAYGGPHWVTYLILSLAPENRAHHELLLRYLCRRDPRWRNIAFEYEAELTRPPGQPPERSNYRMHEVNCP